MHVDQRKVDSHAGLGLGFLGILTFSLTLPMTTIALTGWGPYQVALWRGLIAGFAALLILTILRPSRPRGREWNQVLGCAIGTVVGFPVLMTLAMQTVSASHGTVVVGLLPIVTAMMAAFINGERPPIKFWAVSLLGTALTLTFVLRQAEGSLASGHLFLGLGVLAAGLGYAFGGRLAKRLRGWVVACWSVAVSLPAFGVAAVFVPPINLDVGVSAVGALLYVALASQLLGFFAWYKGMALGGIARVSQVQLFQLFLTVGFAIVFLNEPFHREVLVFGGAVAACVFASTRIRINSVQCR